MKIIGHRGARGLAPENTIAGFKKALQYRVDWIEFDVRTTKDNIPIIHHDKNLRDQSGSKLVITQSSFEELKKHKDDLPTLAETLKFIDGKVALYIEVKPDVSTAPIVEVLKKYRHKFILGSKSQATLLELHNSLPDAPKIVIEPFFGLRATHRARQLNTKMLAMNHHFLWFGFIKAMSNSGYQLWAYTLNEPEKTKRWVKYGLEGVVTDFPDRFV